LRITILYECKREKFLKICWTTFLPLIIKQIKSITIILYKLKYRMGSLSHHSERITSRISEGSGSFSIRLDLIASSSFVNCTSGS
jgi:hypothetical protein